MTRSWTRWSLVAAVLAVAATVAVWPTGSDPAAPVLSAPAAPGVDALRSRAALQPCPVPEPPVAEPPVAEPPVAEPPVAEPPAAPAGPLAGVVVPCLGQEGSVDLGAALAGHPALLNLWGPLCRPCREEMTALAAYAAEPGAVPVLGVEMQRLPEGGLDLMASLDVHYPSVSDPDGVLPGALRSPPVLPLTYLVSPDGRVQQVNPPEVFRDAAAVRAAVQHYLGPAAVR